MATITLLLLTLLAFCSKSFAQSAIQPGLYCDLPQDCISFSHYGSDACSEVCGAKADCELQQLKKGKSCCKAIPESAPCNPTLGGCTNGLICSEELLKCVQKEQKLWIIGVVIAIFAASTVTLGYNIQRFAFKKQKIFPYWYVGFVVYCIGNVATFLAFNFAAQSLVAPLAGFGLVSNAIFAFLINSEVFGWRDAIGITFIISGSILVMFFADRSETAYSLCELLYFYTKIETIIMFALILTALILLWMATLVIQEGMDENYLYLLDPSTPPAVESATSEDEDNEEALLIEKKVHHGRMKKTLLKLLCRNENYRFRKDGKMISIILPLCYVTISAIFGSTTTLLAKSCAELINATLQGNNQFNHFFPFLMIGALIAATVLQITFMNKGLKRYDALLLIPSFHAVWTVLSVLSGGVYFGEFNQFTMKQALFFSSGVLSICLGAAVLATRSQRKLKQ